MELFKISTRPASPPRTAPFTVIVRVSAPPSSFGTSTVRVTVASVTRGTS